MDKAAFKDFMQSREIPPAQIEPFLSLAGQFDRFRSERPGGRTAPTADDVRAFSARLVGEGRNAFDNYRALALYARFLGDNALYVAVVELVDGAEVLENLYDKVGASLGEPVRDRVFAGIELPPLGTPSAGKPGLMQTAMARLEAVAGPEACRALLAGSLRHLPDEWYLKGRETYQACADLDTYLERKGDEFIAQLEQIKAEGGLYFTQEITAEVIDFVESHPEIRQGVRAGNVLYEVKIPYMTREYLAETDEDLKRYYYCHCPWVRESLRTGEAHVSPLFCTCSAGFHKRPWEMIFGRPLEAEIVETVLQGDPWCKIAIHLPASGRA